MNDWTEKYRPTTLRDLVGNDQVISQLRHWATDWTTGTPKKRAVILAGKPGIGKTSAAHALAHDMEWTIIELNASDARNEAILRRIAGHGAANETFDATGHYTPTQQGGRKLIILDEADNLYERVKDTTSKVVSKNRDSGSTDYSDRGAKKAIISIIKTTRQPLILIANDDYALTRGDGEPLKALCLHLTFKPVMTVQITELLKRICHKEGIGTDGKILTAIAARSRGDVRSAVNDLQAISFNRTTLDITALDAVSHRDRETIIFDTVREIFKARDLQTSRTSMRNADVDPELLLQWIVQNIPKEYLDPHDLAAAFDAVAMADVFLGRVSRRQDFDLWAYACDLMSAGVTSAKTRSYANSSYEYPTWIREMTASKQTRTLRDGIAIKLARYIHASRRKVRDFFLLFFQRLYQTDVAFARRMTALLGFTEAEARFLLGKSFEHRLSEILNDEKATAGEKKREQPQEDKEFDERRQPSLLDF